MNKTTKTLLAFLGAIALAGVANAAPGCGPAPMLYALAKTVAKLGMKCEVSMDQRMGCGVGACFACVIKVVDKSSPDGWRYSRSCKEGVVYPAEEVYCG